MAAVKSSETSEAVLKRLEWTVLRRLDGWLQGDWRSLWRGTGLDLADLREYQHLDDVRHIDWNVTARTGVPHVRLFNEDRDLTAWFLVDISASSLFGSQGQSKGELAAEFVGLMARLLTRHGNRVGAIIYSQQVDRIIPPRGGRLQVLQLLEALRSPPTTGAPPSPQGITRLGDLLQAASGHIQRRSSVFVVSDFISEPGWELPLGRLSLHHDVCAVRLFDPLEMQLPNVGTVWMQDAESGEQIQVDTSDARFRKRFAAAADTAEAQLRAGLARAGVDALELTTEEPLFEAMLRFMALRQRRARAFRGGVVGGQVRSADWAENPPARENAAP
ncbi:MAG: hypothetical protein RIS44_1114 [Pseudomonadota bacterium]|jgi:uncharacterized protein (DUF58 family)